MNKLSHKAEKDSTMNSQRKNEKKTTTTKTTTESIICRKCNEMTQKEVYAQ